MMILLYLAFTVFLLVRDRAVRSTTSGGPWLVLGWVLLIGTRPLSMWLDGQSTVSSLESYAEGSPIDRGAYLALIVAGAICVARRNFRWSAFISQNRWLTVFLGFWLLSVVWSDYPFVSLKRWIKDAGNLVMVLVIATERNPIEALRAVFVRFGYIVLPISLGLIRHHSVLGRYYSVDGSVAYNGIATNKNEFGCAIFVSALFLMWDALERRKIGGGKLPLDFASLVILSVLIVWCIRLADSSTALVSLFTAALMLVFLPTRFARARSRRAGLYVGLVLGFLMVLYSLPGVFESFLGALGEDLTFTGRTELWQELLRIARHPILGDGYRSFWDGPGGRHMWAKYWFRPIQAHNGYLETYLNGGLIGLLLLLAYLGSTGRILFGQLPYGGYLPAVRVTAFVVALLYNWTEAMFSGSSLIWFMLLCASVRYLPPAPQTRTVRGGLSR